MRTLSSRPATWCSWRGPGVGEGGRPWWGRLFAVEGGVEGVGGAVEPGAAEVVYEEVAGEGGDPGLEAAFLGVEAGEVLVELEEDVLGEVFGVGAGAGEAVADGVDAAVLGRRGAARRRSLRRCTVSP